MTTRTDLIVVDPTPGAEEHELRLRIRAVVEAEVAPRADGYSRKGTWPERSFQALAEAGVIALAVPEDFGGTGASTSHLCIAVEEIAWGCASTAACVQANWMAAWILRHGGTPAQKERYLPGLAQGTLQGSFGVTESIGRHLSRPPTTAVATDDGWVIDGFKAFVGNGGVADFCVFTALTEVEGRDRPAPSTFVADKSQPGFEVSRVVPKLSIRAYQTADYELRDLRLTRDQLVGELGKGMRLAMATIDMGRTVYAAQCTGIAQRAVDEIATYANHGREESRHLAQYQAIQFMAAESAMATAGARVLLYRAAEQIDDDPRGTVALAAAAKQQAAMAAKVAVDHALQVHGAYGLTDDSVTERLYRDQRVTEIGVGTNEAMKTVVGKAVLEAGAAGRK